MPLMSSAPNNHSSLTLLPAKRKQLTERYRAFSADYLPSAPAQQYLAMLTDSRAVARANYLVLVARAERGEEITEAVLRTLLPHADSTSNRWRGVWIHPAPAIPGDLRTWHEAAGWSKGDEWPMVAAAIFDLVRNVIAEPAQCRFLVLAGQGPAGHHKRQNDPRRGQPDQPAGQAAARSPEPAVPGPVPGRSRYVPRPFRHVPSDSPANGVRR